MKQPEKKCVNCGKLFVKTGKDTSSYWIKKRFCSISCSSIFNKVGYHFLGKKFTKQHVENLSKNNARHWLGKHGENSSGWKGGVIEDGRGYILIWEPEHPKNRKGYILQHRSIMEKKIGRYLLENEVVHHINRIRNDNRVENLIVMTNSEHTRYHQKNKK